jgi:uncharacterized protein (DUF488 family)
MAVELHTIGFAGKSAEQFFAALAGSGIQCLLDVRRSNNTLFCGFTRVRDLPFFLERLGGIGYVHEPEFAPSLELLRNYQRRLKKKRGQESAWTEYVARFSEELAVRPVCELYRRHLSGRKRLCLLCAEASPKHCHRRLLAEYIASHCDKRVRIVHL